MRNVAIYVTCPECDTSVPANFEFEYLNDPSHPMKIKCQGCGVTLKVEALLQPQYSIDGSDWEDTGFYVR